MKAWGLVSAVLRGQWQFWGWGASLGWGISPGPQLFLYINLHLYLGAPVRGQEESIEDQTVLLYLTILHRGPQCKEFAWIAVAR